MNNDYVSGRLNNYFNDLLHKYPETPPTQKYFYDFVNKNMLFIIIIVITIIYFTYKYYYNNFEYRYPDNHTQNIKNLKYLKKKKNIQKEKMKRENDKIRREKEQLLSIIDELNDSIDNSSYVEQTKPPVVIQEHAPHNQTPYNQPHGSNQFSTINNNSDNFGGYQIVPPYSQ